MTSVRENEMCDMQDCAGKFEMWIGYIREDIAGTGGNSVKKDRPHRKPYRTYSGGGIFENGSGFYYYTGKIFDVMAVSVLWLLASLPLVTVGASFSALYAAASHSLQNDEGSVAKQFWRAWKRDLKSAVLLWLLFAGALFLLLLNIGIVWRVSDGLFRLFFILLYGVCTALVLAALIYAFPALSRFDMPVGWIVKLSFYMVFRNLPYTVLLLLLFAGGYFLVLCFPYLVLLVPGAVAWADAVLIDPLLARHAPEEDNSENCP